MPRKHIGRPQHVIDEALKRYLSGERAAALAKEYGISKAGIYLWLRKGKETMIENAKRADMSPRDKEAADMLRLRGELEEEKRINARLKNKLIDLMVRAGEL
jgi:transposase-like protein